MTERFRILHLIKGLGRGGAEVLLAEGLRAANRADFHYVYAYHLPWKDQLVAALTDQGASVHCLEAGSAGKILARVPRLVRLLRHERVDLVHCHLSLSAVAGRLAGRFAGVPVVYTQHGPLEFSNRFSRRANLATWPLQERVIAVSQEVTESIARHAGEIVPVRLVENGVATHHFSPDEGRRLEARRELGIAPDAPVVGTVAVFRPQKRLDLWMEVGARLCAERPDARLLIVGDGPLRDDLARRAADLDLSRALIFAGLQEDVRPFLDAMDLYLMTSDFEGFPVALLEAMSMELPVVSTAVGGIVDVLDPPCGITTPAGDVNALVDAVFSLMTHDDRRREMGRGARRTVLERFGMERMVRELESIYREVLAERAS